MSGVELALAVIATIDLCFKRGKDVIDKYSTYQNAPQEVIEDVTRFQLVWLRIGDQLGVLKNIASYLDETHLQVLDRALSILNSKLDGAASEISTVFRTYSGTQVPPLNKLKYTFKKESVHKALKELEEWQQRFDPSWYLTMKVSAPEIDVELKKHSKLAKSSPIFSARSMRAVVNPEQGKPTPIFLPPDGLRGIQRVKIPFSTASVGARPDQKSLLLEHIDCPSWIDRSMFEKNVRDLARRLNQSDPGTFRLLNCKGVVKHLTRLDTAASSVTLIFRFPEGCSDPRSLRDCLIGADRDHSLSERFRLAYELARAISYIHTFGFVHKALRPEKILVFDGNFTELGSLFAVGFEQFRPAEGITARAGDSIWQHNLYRHPRRQGPNPEDDYIMQHDIYSLGVCLLEIGLWESLVLYEDDGLETFPGAALGFSATRAPPEFQETKETLLKVAQTVLPRRMGSKYAAIVHTCLTCLDEDNADFGDEKEFQDEDGILVGARYIEKILTQLSDIYV